MKKTEWQAALLIGLIISAIFILPVSSAQPYIYHNNLTLHMDLQKLAEAHPDLARLYSIGKSVLGQDIWCIEITNFSRAEPKPVIYLDGSHHGNEQLAMELCYVFAVFLLEEYKTNETARNLVDKRHFYITPLINPDGNAADLRYNIHLVDLNRNYPYEWNGDGDLLGLSSPGSEPEVQANMGIIQKINPDLYITFHTGTTVVIYPWGWTPDPPPDEQVYIRLCDEIQNLTGLEYGQINSPAMYPAFGTSLDWTYGALGIISYCIEVDDEQWVPASLEDIRSRLWQSFKAVEYSSEVVELLGAKLEVLDIQILPQSRNQFTISFLLNNKGFGSTTNLSIEIESDAGLRIISKNIPSSIPSDSSLPASFSFQVQQDGIQKIYLDIGYNRTVQMGRYIKNRWTYQVEVGEKKIEVTETIPAAPENVSDVDVPMEERTYSAERPSEQKLPGFEFVGFVILLAVLLVLRRR